HAGLVRRAAEAGGTILAGTELPVGHLVDEIEWLVTAGLTPERAIGAASWTARDTLGFPGLRDGERADLIWMDSDPRGDVDVLREPGVIVLDEAVVERSG